MLNRQRRTKEKWARGMRRIALAGACAVIALAAGVMPTAIAPPAEATGEGTRVKRGGRIVTYLSDASNLPLPGDGAAKPDQINYAFALIEDGEATGAHWRGVKQLERYLRAHPEVDGVLSVGGWGADGFSDACATEAGRQKLAASILRLVDDHGFVGVDIDWEYPGSSAAGVKSRPEDEENWYALLGVLREGLDARQAEQGRDFLLSVAVGAGAQQLAAADGARLNRLVDQVVVMAYDLKGFERVTGHHAGLYPAEPTPGTGAYAVEALTRSGLAEAKVLLGMPAYARVWRQVSGGGDGLDQRAATSGSRTMSYDAAQALEKEGYTRYYDEKAKAAWLFNGDIFVSVEDERSVAEKVAWTLKNKLLGVAVWSMNQDADGTMHALLDQALSQ